MQIIYYYHFLFQTILNVLSYHHIQEAVAEKKKKGRNMTSQERKWCVAEEQRRHELIRGLFTFFISYLFTFQKFPNFLLQVLAKN